MSSPDELQIFNPYLQTGCRFRSPPTSCVLDLTLPGGRAADGVGGVVVSGFKEHIVDVLANGSVDVFRKSYRMKLTLRGEDVPSTGLAVLSSPGSRGTLSMSSSTVPSMFFGRATE